MGFLHAEAIQSRGIDKLTHRVNDDSEENKSEGLVKALHATVGERRGNELWYWREQ